ncbi:MAG: hypothetical protein Fur0039_12920 [Rhodocyclaceae bacterium]
MIPQSFIQDLLARIDIVDVVGRYVPLKRAGANHVACCPFHAEKTPSFTVSPSKQFYHCFGCGAHGSAIGFLMEHAGLSFVDAVHELAGRAGMTVPAESSPGPASGTAELLEAMKRAADYYRASLKAAERAIRYLRQRGVSGEIAARFGIGYAPEGWHNLAAVFSHTEAGILHRCGLTVESEGGRFYDRFRDRVMFPILDARGNVIAFGGRVIDAGEPKYMNSPETPLFEKRRELYGLTQARAAIREADSVIVVEGYMDVVALAQHGVSNVVATLGTATTGEHVQKLFRHARRVVFCFDGDEAGRRAAWRALEASLGEIADDRSAGFMFLPPEHDPDSFVRASGADAFRSIAANPIPLTELLLRELRGRNELASAEGRSRMLAEAKPQVLRVAAPMLRAQLVRSVAELARLAPAEVGELFGLKTIARRDRAGAPVPRQRSSLSRRILRIILQKPEWSAGVPVELLPDGEPEAALLGSIASAFDRGELPAGRLDTVVERFRGTPHEAVLDAVCRESVAEPIDAGALEAVFADAVDQLRRQCLSRDIAALNAKERSGGLNGEERRRLAELLARKQGLAASRQT